MSIEVQGSIEWLEARAKIPTASNFHKVITAKTRKPAKTDYPFELAVNSVIGYEPSWGGNASTERGHELEAVARSWYESMRDVDVMETGFHTNLLGEYGCSPDGVIHDDPEGHGGLEIKCFEAKHHAQAVVHFMETGRQLPEQYPQTMGQLLVMEKMDDWKWVDTVYWHPHPKMKNIRVRTYRDDEYMLLLEECIQGCIQQRDYIIEQLEKIS